MNSFDIKKALGQPKELEVYNKDVIVKRSLLFAPKKGEGTGNKKAITKLTQKSLKRLAFFANNTAQQFYVMLTLTYPKGSVTDGKVVKRNLNHFLVMLRKRRRNLKYLWFLEFQLRGAPHFHILLSTKWIEKEWVALVWNAIVAPYDLDHFQAGTRTEKVRDKDGAKKYAVQYAMKWAQKIVPINYQDVGRWWGHSYGISPKLIRTIQVLGYEDVWHILSSWTYVEKINHDNIITVLYNAAEYLRY